MNKYDNFESFMLAILKSTAEYPRLARSPAFNLIEMSLNESWMAFTGLMETAKSSAIRIGTLQTAGSSILGALSSIPGVGALIGYGTQNVSKHILDNMRFYQKFKGEGDRLQSIFRSHINEERFLNNLIAETGQNLLKS